MKRRALLAIVVGIAMAIACACSGRRGAKTAAARTPAPARDDTLVTSTPPAWSQAVCGGDRNAWCWGYPRPLGMRLAALWGPDARDLWAVGERGTIAHFDGTRFSQLHVDSDDALVAISGRAAGDAWAVGRERTLLRLEGSSWRRSSEQLPTEGTFADVVALDNGEAWLVGGIERTSLGRERTGSSCIVGHYDGARWLFEQDDACDTLTSVWGTRPDEIWARGGDVVHWNGRYLVKNPSERAAKMIGRHGFAAGWQLEKESAVPEGRLSHPRYTPKDAQGNAVALQAQDFWAYGEDDVWALQAGALAHFDGKLWTRGDEALSIKCVFARAANDVWAAGSPATLLHYDGARWSSWPIPGWPSDEPRALAALAANDIWLITGRQLLRFDGKRWTELPTDTHDFMLSALLALGTDDVWIANGTRALHWNGHALEAHALDFSAGMLWGTHGDVWAGPDAHRFDGTKFVTPPEFVRASDVAGAPSSGKYWAGTYARGSVWLLQGSRIDRWHAGRLQTIKTLPVAVQAIWASPSGDDIWAVGSQIVHGHGDSWTIEPNLGLSGMSAVGGAEGLVWVRGQQGILFRSER